MQLKKCKLVFFIILTLFINNCSYSQKIVNLKVNWVYDLKSNKDVSFFNIYYFSQSQDSTQAIKINSNNIDRNLNTYTMYNFTLSSEINYFFMRAIDSTNLQSKNSNVVKIDRPKKPFISIFIQ
jgi:hypothetical protein